MKMNRIALAALSLIALPVMAQVVIISAKNPLSKLTKEQVSQIFMGQTSTFITGGKVDALDLGEDSPLRKEFYQKVVNKAPAQMKAHWSKMEFSGNGRAHRTLPTSAEVVKLVAENPKYIGYVDAASVNPSVKVVFALN